MKTKGTSNGTKRTSNGEVARMTRQVRPSGRWGLILACLALTAGVAACGGTAAPNESAGAGSQSGRGGGTSPSAPGSCELPHGEVTKENNCKFTGQTITVAEDPGTLGETVKKGLTKAFEETTGGHIDWVMQDSKTLMAKQIANKAAGRSNKVDVDLAVNIPNIYPPYEAGLFQQVPKDAIPNWSDIPDKGFAIPGYGAGMYYWLVGLCYDPQKFNDAGLPEPKGVDDVLNDPHAILGLPSPGSTRWELFTYAFAASHGVAMDDPDGVLNLLSRASDRIKLYVATPDADELLQHGGAWAVVTSNGHCNGMIKDGANYVYGSLGLTVEGTKYDYVMTVTTPEVLASSDQPEMAHALINTLFTKEVLLPIYDNYIYDMTSRRIAKAAKEHHPDLVKYLHPDFSDLYFDTDQLQKFMGARQDWVHAWNATFTN